SDGEGCCYDGVRNPQPFHIKQASAARYHFAINPRAEAIKLASYRTERFDGGHISDDINHLPVDCRCLGGKLVRKRFSGPRQPKHGADNPAPGTTKAARHWGAYCYHQGDCRDCRQTRRQHVPNEHILYRKDRVGGCGDPAGQYSRQLVDKIARSMPGHVTKQITAQITSYFDKRCARDPACGTPKQIVGSDKRTQQQEGYPDTLR